MPLTAIFTKNAKHSGAPAGDKHSDGGGMYLLIKKAGKPAPLLGNLAGYWSRRIDETHRLVYAADDADLDVIACRGHYDD